MKAKLVYMRRILETGLSYVGLAISENNQDDPKFVKEKVSMALTFVHLSARAETVDQMTHVNRRVNIFVNSIASRLPYDYCRQLCKHADNEHKDWLRRRNSLIEHLNFEALWKLEPYGTDVTVFYENTVRSCIAIPPEKRAEIMEEIELLAAEAELIKSMFNAVFGRSGSSMWLPIIVSEGFKKLVFTEHDAYSSEDENIKTLQHGKGLNAESLNVDDFLAVRGWRRDQVTIRRSSGSRYVARLWTGANVERIQSNCVLVDFANDLDQRVSVRQPGAKRVDAQKPAAIWHQYEILYYPDGRPRKPKGKI
ncbi:MAG: hypothetical protein HXX17_06065 [Geobacteraceae bacterium]|nr:hypothetical protein [Geobacteraceae bacterium]